MPVSRPLPVLEPAAAPPAPRPATTTTPATEHRYSGRLLITGASGFLGRNLARAFRHHQLVAVAGFRRQPPIADVGEATARECVDLGAATNVARLIQRWRPDAVIHAAGLKNVRGCEDNPEDAVTVNVDGTRNLAEACARTGTKLIYLSTDLVFDGESKLEPGGYRPLSPARPTTVYGRTKLEGERVALESSTEAVVCRTGGVYGAGSPLLAWLHQELAAGRRVEAFQDVVSTPTAADDLASMLDRVLAQEETGILHLAGSEAVSLAEWFSHFANAFGYD